MADQYLPDERARLRQQMAEVRHRLYADVDDAKKRASQLTDWKHYVRHFPWITSAFAGLIGFLLFPRRAEKGIAADAKAGFLGRIRQMFQSAPSHDADAEDGIMQKAARGVVRFAAGKALGPVLDLILRRKKIAVSEKRKREIVRS